MSYIAEKTWNNVHTLSLCKMLNNKDRNKIGDEGIPHLQAFPNVQSLNINYCKIHAEGVKKLS